ncbi:MAG: hypothetical protein SNJ09_08135 [Rikenellaceae bacterium]
MTAFQAEQGSFPAGAGELPCRSGAKLSFRLFGGGQFTCVSLLKGS